MTWIEWYNSLEKPSWTPSPAVIGQIWGMLYPVLFLSLAFVLIQAIRGKLPWKVLIPFGINLVANLIFTPIQFGLRNLPLASLDILLIGATILWMMVAVWKFSRWVAVAQVPYLIWVSIATVLQLTITWKNW
ncbi:MAG: TspO/MBR family protein [Verrucomicrobiota bacterium]